MRVETVKKKATKRNTPICDECALEPGDNGEILPGDKRLIIESSDRIPSASPRTAGARISKCAYHAEKFLKWRIAEYANLLKEITGKSNLKS